MQAFDRSRAEWNVLYYEVLHNLVLETTRNGIELKNLKMRVEALASRLDFSERRVRALEGVVQYRPEAVRAATRRVAIGDRDRHRDRPARLGRRRSAGVGSATRRPPHADARGGAGDAGDGDATPGDGAAGADAAARAAWPGGAGGPAGRRIGQTPTRRSTASDRRRRRRFDADDAAMTPISTWPSDSGAPRPLRRRSGTPTSE